MPVCLLSVCLVTCLPVSVYVTEALYYPPLFSSGRRRWRSGGGGGGGGLCLDLGWTTTVASVGRCCVVAASAAAAALCIEIIKTRLERRSDGRSNRCRLDIMKAILAVQREDNET